MNKFKKKVKSKINEFIREDTYKKEFGQHFIRAFRNLINEGLRIYNCIGIRKLLIEGRSIE